jgi:hypothetical protein
MTQTTPDTITCEGTKQDVIDKLVDMMAEHAEDCVVTLTYDTMALCCTVGVEQAVLYRGSNLLPQSITGSGATMEAAIEDFRTKLNALTTKPIGNESEKPPC